MLRKADLGKIGMGRYEKSPHESRLVFDVASEVQHVTMPEYLLRFI